MSQLFAFQHHEFLLKLDLLWKKSICSLGEQVFFFFVVFFSFFFFLIYNKHSLRLMIATSKYIPFRVEPFSKEMKDSLTNKTIIYKMYKKIV